MMEQHHLTEDDIHLKFKWQFKVLGQKLPLSLYFRFLGGFTTDRSGSGELHLQRTPKSIKRLVSILIAVLWTVSIFPPLKARHSLCFLDEDEETCSYRPLAFCSMQFCTF